MHAPHISGFSGISARFVHLMLALVLALLALGPLSRLQLAASPSPPSSPKLSLFAQQPLAFVPLAGGEDGEAGFRAGAVTFAPLTIDFALPVLPAGAPP
ncbi:MAG: hypothetical protein ACK2U9_06350, partial [Anaerolineae bacterium]